MIGDVSTIDGSGRVVDDTTDGIILVDADTTNGAELLTLQASGNLTYPLDDRSSTLCATSLLHLQTIISLIYYALGTISSSFVWFGVNGL